MSDITDPDPRHLRETMIMLNRAIVNGWHIPDAVMSAAPLVVGRMLRDGTAREQLRAAEVLIRMRDSNIAALEIADKLERLDNGGATERVVFEPIVIGRVARVGDTTLLPPVE